MKRNRTTNTVVDLNSCSEGQVPQEDQPSLSNCLGFSIVHSPYSSWLAILCVLLEMMLTYSFDNDCQAHASAASTSTEDPEAIIVTGTASQQRDAVLANFAKYSNRTGESVSRVR